MKDLGGLEMKNEILQTGKVLKVGYCGLQNLLAYESPVAFIVREQKARKLLEQFAEEAARRL